MILCSWISRALLFAFVSLILGGCAKGEQGRDKGTLVAAIGSDPGHLNSAITTNGSVQTAAGLLYNGLLSLDDDLTPRPELAERWDIEDYGARYRFHLRRDVRWHDGVPFTSADVKFTFEELLLKFHSRARASLGPALLRIDAPDDSTVVFQFRHPYAPLLQQLDVGEAPIMPRHVFASTDPLRNPANVAPTGTGPFRFVAYNPNGEIRYRANADYFRGPPPLDAVVLRIIPDPGTQVMALEAGEVDWLFAVPGPERQRLRADPRIRLIQGTVNSGGSNCVMTLGFNLDRPWFRDIRVRRAFAHAFDRQQFLERVLFGEGRVAEAPISSRIGFAHASDLAMPPFDTARSKQLLDAVGWRRVDDEVRTAHDVPGIADGTPFVIGFKGMPSQMVYGDLLRAQLRAIGIELRLEPLDPAVFAHAVFTARDFDTAIAAYCNGTDPEIGVRRQLVSSNIGPIPFSNMAGYRNPVMDSLFERAGAALAVEDRRGFYRQIQEIAIEDQPYVWLVETIDTRAHSVRCRGFRTSAHFAAMAECSE